MQDKKKTDLANYRIKTAEETLVVANECFDNHHYKDAINRSYYAAFYAAKAVLALDEKDFKRHKDVVSYFNQNYVATELIPKDVGRKMARLQKKREESDYDDFYIASVEEARKQIDNSTDIIKSIKDYLGKS